MIALAPARPTAEITETAEPESAAPLSPAQLARTRLDAQLVPALRSDDAQVRREGFTALYEHYHRPLYNFVLRMLFSMPGGTDDAEDVTQDAFLNIHRAIERRRLAADSHLQAWCFRVATNVCMDYLRHRRLVRWNRLEDLFGGTFIGRSLGPRSGETRESWAFDQGAPKNVPDAIRRFGGQLTDANRDQQPEQWALDGEAQEHVQRTLDRLPPKHRMVLILREYQDLRYDEIAEVLNTTRAAVKSLLFRAREEFRVVYPRVSPLHDQITEGSHAEV